MSDYVGRSYQFDKTEQITPFIISGGKLIGDTGTSNPVSAATYKVLGSVNNVSHESGHDERSSWVLLNEGSKGYWSVRGTGSVINVTLNSKPIDFASPDKLADREVSTPI